MLRAASALALVASIASVATSASAQTVTKGPWALAVDSDSALLRIETDRATALTVDAQAIGDDGAQVLAFGGQTAGHSDGEAVGTIRLTGLEPDTRYSYVVRVGSEESTGELWTAPAEGTPFTFLVYGDDRTKHDVHREVIERMLEHTDARMVLHTGDFVEMGGRPSDWGDFFDIAGPLLRRVALFPSLGNHELYGPGGLLRYHRYLSAEDTRETWYRQDYGDLTLIALDSNLDWEEGTAQHDWLTTTLAELSEDRFILMHMHHGPYSSGRHGGHSGMAAMDLADQLRAEGVDLIFSGHDHDYERGDAEGLKYVVTGGGGAPLYTVNEHLPYQQAFEPAHHYLHMELDDGRLSMRVIRRDGSLLEACSFAQGEPWACEGGTDAGPVTEGISRTRYIYDAYVKRYLFYAIAIPVVVIAFLYAWRRRRRTRAELAAEEAAKKKRDDSDA